ncbi:hypothetical protein RND71_031951 [Anisodus tanguticus]|uniref:Uncharacterized protein n=1 Tax=Anisodus tanguticus TaxID=243964 RepID=A0AAE1V3Q4_9SOLA|nr:hypothetical protein RND71_031951 [Anisodus tanguticus]
MNYESLLNLFYVTVVSSTDSANKHPAGYQEMLSNIVGILLPAGYQEMLSNIVGILKNSANKLPAGYQEMLSNIVGMLWITLLVFDFALLYIVWIPSLRITQPRDDSSTEHLASHSVSHNIKMAIQYSISRLFVGYVICGNRWHRFQDKENNISLKVGEFQETIMDDKCNAKKVLILGVSRVCRPAAELLASIGSMPSRQGLKSSITTDFEEQNCVQVIVASYSSVEEEEKTKVTTWEKLFFNHSTRREWEPTKSRQLHRASDTPLHFDGSSSQARAPVHSQDQSLAALKVTVSPVMAPDASYARAAVEADDKGKKVDKDSTIEKHKSERTNGGEKNMNYGGYQRNNQQWNPIVEKRSEKSKGRQAKKNKEIQKNGVEIE